MKKMIAVVAIGAALFSAACTHQSDKVSANLSKAADSFEISRRIVFYNGITGERFLTIEGLCALGNDDPANELSVVCKVGPDRYIKDFLGLSDNVTYYVEQLTSAYADAYHYRLIFTPETVIPNVDTQTSGDESGK